MNKWLITTREERDGNVYYETIMVHRHPIYYLNELREEGFNVSLMLAIEVPLDLPDLVEL